MRETRDDVAPATGVRPLAPSEALDCRGGGDHEDPWLWLIMGTLEPPDVWTGTGPTCPRPPS